jgi:UDP-3-O-[3-hydroxymyristoyl] glucosamine N-acyltransferase
MVRALTVGQLAAAIEAQSAGALPVTVRGDAACRIERVAPLESATAGALSFLANPRYRRLVASSAASALLVNEADADALAAAGATRAVLLVCGNPYAAFAWAAQALHPAEPVAAGCAATAVVDPAAHVDATARIDAGAVVEADVEVGAAAYVGAGVFLGRGAHIGAATRLMPGARVMAECRIGARCTMHPNAVIGADGFGFAPFEGRWIKIPQTGRVVVGDDVEIGANTTIDRGTMGDTVIENGVKLDNQIQIGHNCRIGAHTVIAGCVGIAGSTTVGKRCQLGGAAMILGHLTIADGCVISTGTLVSRSISEPGFYTGFFPLMKNRDWERNAAVLRQLDDLRDRVRQLEAQSRQPRDAQGDR